MDAVDLADSSRLMILSAGTLATSGRPDEGNKRGRLGAEVDLAHRQHVDVTSAVSIEERCGANKEHEIGDAK